MHEIVIGIDDTASLNIFNYIKMLTVTAPYIVCSYNISLQKSLEALNRPVPNVK